MATTKLALQPLSLSGANFEIRVFWGANPGKSFNQPEFFNITGILQVPSNGTTCLAVS